MENKKSGKLSLATILSYGMAYGSGYQIMGSLVGSYLMIFFTDTFGIPAAAAGVIMVLASIWDAINDPIMGVVADKTHTRFGKFRPYLLWVPGCLTVAVVCLFMSPNLSSTGKIIWAAVFYILYGMLRTAFEIPCNANENILVALERAGVAGPNRCRGGICGWCRSRLLSGDVFIPEDTDGRRAQDKLDGYIHPCATFAVSDLSIEMPLKR